MSVELLEHRTAQRGLACAHFAGQLDKALALANPVEEMIVSLPVLRAVKQKPWIRRNVERRLCQAVMFEIHVCLLLAERVPVGNKESDTQGRPRTNVLSCVQTVTGHFL